MTTVYTNKFTLQINDSVRLICYDERPGVVGTAPFESSLITVSVGELVMSLPNARALRDMLVEYVKDDAPPGFMQ